MTAVGIDMGKAVLDVAVEGVPGVTRFANGRACIGKLVRRRLVGPCPSPDNFALRHYSAVRFSKRDPARQ